MRKPALVIQLGGHTLHFKKCERSKGKLKLLYISEEGIPAYDPPQPTGTEPKKNDGTRLVFVVVAAVAALLNF